MDVTLSLIADSANVSDDGKLNIIGEFDTIFASDFPWIHGEIVIVLRFSASPAEVGDMKAMVIRCINEDGLRMGEMAADIQVPAPAVPGSRSKLQTIIPLQNLRFPESGVYSFHILINGETKAEIPLTLGLFPE